MFDKLIESDTAAVVNGRSRYFMLSTVVVGALFLTAVILSLYARDIDLGVDKFDTATLLAPVAAEAPEAPRSHSQQQQALTTTDQPRRQANILRPEETPTEIPPVSVTQNTQRSRPLGDFRLSLGPETYAIGEQGVNLGTRTGQPQGTGSADASEPATETPDKLEVSPPPVKTKEERPKILKVSMVLNGKARLLPKPPYPQMAAAVGAAGEVSVQVTIDESGNVISSHAVSGHPFLKQAAERAALGARFTPTILNDQPVKVTGVIVYRFTRN